MIQQSKALASQADLLANRFDELSSHYPMLRLVSARRPKSFDSVSCEQNVWEGELIGTHPDVKGRYAHQMAFSQEPARTNSGRLELPSPSMRFPYWLFDADDQVWKHGYWAMWLHRDFGRKPGNEAGVANPQEQLACLEAYLLAFESAAYFAREVSDLLEWPKWVFEHEDNSCRSHHPEASTQVLTWLILLLGYSPTRRDPRFHDNSHSTIETGEMNHHAIITLDLIHDLGLDSSRLLRSIKHQLAECPEPTEDGPVAPSTWRHNGEVIDAQMNQLAWKMVNYLWSCRLKSCRWEDLAEPVYGDERYPVYGEVVPSLSKKANKFLRDHGIAWKVENRRRESFVKLEENPK